ncbi:M14 family metallopeptidase [uncultured Tenacibaculum sp.]|uniref:M14 family metallopeptidase n=1 Tax=uncultured Tenacibaculum sp. TaxID=174713 RepID=UPI0026209387|nr:M14 family metallopeptidase [uncultured Tenacibaculum sp.]
MFSTEKGVYASNKFNGARLSDFFQENDSVYTVFIQPENTPINNSAYYSFKLWSDQSEEIYLKFKYPQGYKHRYIPKIKARTEHWKSIDSSLIYKKDSLFMVKLNLSKDTTWVSAQEVVTVKDTENWCGNLVHLKPYVHLKSVGKTKLGRNIPVLDIYKESKEHKPIVVLLTRQHPPEVTGFFAYQEFLKTVLKENKLSEVFFSKYRILTFPIVNPDGVDLGHWRHNANGVDTNRDWSQYRQSEIKQIVKYISKESKKYKGKIVLGLDFHSTYEDVFYTNKIREGTSFPDFIKDWFKALEKEIPNYKVNEKPGNSKKPVSKGWFLYGHNAVGITYEIGDETPRDRIKLIGRITAEEMMRVLNQY